MNNDNSWTISSSSHVSIIQFTPLSGVIWSCLRIKDIDEEDCYIRRSVSNDYNSYLLKVDVAADMEDHRLLSNKI